jgi:hypothetical protein
MRTRRPARFDATAPLTLTTKDKPPIILFSTRLRLLDRMRRTCSTVAWSQLIRRGLLFLGSQDLRKPVEASFPPGSGHHAGQRRGKAGVPNCDSRSSVDLLQMIGHLHWPDGLSDRNPGVYQLSRRIDCGELAAVKSPTNRSFTSDVPTWISWTTDRAPRGRRAAIEGN